MPSLLGTYVTTNYNRVVGPDYTASGDVRTYTGPFSNFGTRLLKFYSVTAEVTVGGAAVDFSVGWSDSGSAFALAILALQQFGEVFFVGTPDAVGFVVALADNTANGADSGNDQGTGFGLMEAAIAAAVGCEAATVTGLSASGVSIA